MPLLRLVLLQALLVLCTEAKIYAWGVNDYGQLGLNGSIHKYPQPIPTYNDIDIVDLKASGTYHMAVAASGDVYVCGNNWYGGLGLPIPSTGEFVGFPKKNAALKNCKIYVGKRHGNAVCGNKFYGWGVQAGYVVGYSEGIYSTVTESNATYQFGSNVKDVQTGSHHSLLTLANGTMYIAGGGNNGVLAMGDMQPRPSFVKFDAFDTIPLLKIFPSHAEHICAISQTYSLYCWGSNSVGQLGIGSKLSQSRPTLVSFFEKDHFVIQVTTGTYHSLALTAGGRVFAWGQAQSGVLGNGRSDNVTFPTPIEIESLADKNVVEIVSGLNFNFARTAQNQWYCWGAGSGGVLGSRSDSDASKPVLAVFSSSFNITKIYTASTSRSVYGWFDPAAPTIRSGPPLTNECQIPGYISCKQNAHCLDTDRSAVCACDKGFSGDVNNCQDINECLIPGSCVAVATCTNLPGSYNCSCPSNFPIGDGKSSGTGCKIVPPVATTAAAVSTAAAATAAAATAAAATGSAAAASAKSSTTSTSGAVQSSTTQSPPPAPTPRPTASPTKSAATNPPNGNQQASSSNAATASSTSGSATTGVNAATTGANSATTTPTVSTTTARTNYYQTLSGVKEIPKEGTTEGEDSFIRTPTRPSKAKDDKWKPIFIGVAIGFGVLMVAAIAVGVFFEMK